MKAASVIFSALVGLATTSVALDKIVIKGSNTFGEELGPRLIAAYAKIRPEVIIELEREGTASGFAALLEGKCDVAAASRPANEDEERLAHSRGVELKFYPIGFYGAALVVNASNRVDSLSDVQVRDLFAGKIKNWKEVGGADGPVQTYIRQQYSGTHLGFRELAMASLPYAANAKPLKDYPAIAEAVGADPVGIGYIGVIPDLNPRVKLVRVNNELPSPQSVNAGMYPYARELRFYLNVKKASPAAKEFVGFVRSRAGELIVTSMGFVRHIEPKVWPPQPLP